MFLGDSAPQHISPPRRQRKRGKRDTDVVMKDSDPDPELQPEPEQEPEQEPGADQDDENEREDQGMSSSNESQQGPNSGDLMDDDDVDPFRSGLFGARTPFGLQSTLRALSGMMSGLSSRLRDILVNLKMKEDPSIQLIALQELSDLLLVSNEDNLAGQFSSDAFVKELVILMQPSEIGEENPEIMLLACRSLANLMEAIRGSVANVVHGGAVPILCQKLLDIQFIDLAEQALSVCFFLFPPCDQVDGSGKNMLTVTDTGQNLGRFPGFHCSRGWSHSMFNLSRFLPHKHAAYRRYHCC